MLVSPTDHIGTNDKYSKFVKFISDQTGETFADIWEKNARANQRLVRKHGWCCSDLQDAHVGKTAVLMGGSPAIAKQVDKLRALQDDPDFILIGMSSGVPFLLDNGIVPKYVMLADASPEMVRFWKGHDLSPLKDTTLIASVSVGSEMLDLWPGKLKFIAYYSSEKKLDKALKTVLKPVNGIGGMFYALSCQYNSAAAICATVFRCAVQIFVGCEFGFPGKDGTYYAGREDEKDKWERSAHIDIYGNVAYTTHILFSLKLALEDFTGKLSGAYWFFNCTEAGILGVKMDDNKKAEHLPWIFQLPLDTGIAHARSIMNTGEPVLTGV